MNISNEVIVDGPKSIMLILFIPSYLLNIDTNNMLLIRRMRELIIALHVAKGQENNSGSGKIIQTICPSKTFGNQSLESGTVLIQYIKISF